MRIAFVAQPFDWMNPPVRDGSLALWIYYMAKKCVQRGHEAVIFANHGGLLWSEVVNADNVDYVFLPTGLDRLLNKLFRTGLKLFPDNRPSGTLVSEAALPWHHQGYAMQVARRARRMNCDVVHVMNYSQFVPVIRKSYPRCKISLHMQCEWLTQFDPGMVEQRLRQTDAVIGCSEYITRKIAARFPEHAQRCVTVPNATDALPDDCRAVGGSNTVLFVGRLSPEKGIHDLIKAFHLVLRRFPDTRLHLVGGVGTVPLEFLVGLSDEPHVSALQRFYPAERTGDKDPYLQVLEKEAGEELGKRIIFEGRVDHNQIESFYQRAAVLVNPSLSESFGISLIEAMMRGIPVVATRIGGMTYTVEHGRTGYLVEPADPESLAAALCDTLVDRTRASEMGEAGRLRAIEMFSWDSSADLLLKHYQHLLS